jgi:hypothetical protein
VFILGLGSSPDQSLLCLLFHVAILIFGVNAMVIRKFLSPGALLLRWAFSIGLVRSGSAKAKE